MQVPEILSRLETLPKEVKEEFLRHQKLIEDNMDSLVDSKNILLDIKNKVDKEGNDKQKVEYMSLVNPLKLIIKNLDESNLCRSGDYYLDSYLEAMLKIDWSHMDEQEVKNFIGSGQAAIFEKEELFVKNAESLNRQIDNHILSLPIFTEESQHKASFGSDSASETGSASTASSSFEEEAYVIRIKEKLKELPGVVQNEFERHQNFIEDNIVSQLAHSHSLLQKMGPYFDSNPNDKLVGDFVKCKNEFLITARNLIRSNHIKEEDFYFDDYLKALIEIPWSKENDMLERLKQGKQYIQKKENSSMNKITEMCARINALEIKVNKKAPLIMSKSPGQDEGVQPKPVTAPPKPPRGDLSRKNTASKVPPEKPEKSKKPKH